MKKRFSLAGAAMVALALPSSAIEIVLDYQYDTNGFFNSAPARQGLRAVADLFEKLITDELAPIRMADWGANDTWTDRFTHPGTGERVERVDLDIPADTVIIYAGSRILGGGTTGRAGPSGFSARGSSAFLRRIRGRGKVGAEDRDNPTDISLRTGAVTFDFDRQWNFSQSQNSTGSEFMSTALHEFCHIFGIGTGSRWDTLIAGETFVGPSASLAFGGPIPLQSGGGHWQNDGECQGSTGFVPGNPLNVLSKRLGIFGQTQGSAQIALMDPSRCDNGINFQVLTDLELAAFSDLGWRVNPLLSSSFTRESNETFSISYNSQSGFNYTLQRSTNLDNFIDITSAVPGNGDNASFNSGATSGPQAFFRVSAVSSQTQSASLRTLAKSQETEFATDSEAPAEISCECFSHEHSE